MPKRKTKSKQGRRKNQFWRSKIRRKKERKRNLMKISKLSPSLLSERRAKVGRIDRKSVV